MKQDEVADVIAGMSLINSPIRSVTLATSPHRHGHRLRTSTQHPRIALSSSLSSSPSSLSPARSQDQTNEARAAHPPPGTRLPNAFTSLPSSKLPRVMPSSPFHQSGPHHNSYDIAQDQLVAQAISVASRGHSWRWLAFGSCETDCP